MSIRDGVPATDTETGGADGAGPAWPAPLARGPVTARVEVTGSKSATNRALILAALADGPSVLRRPLRSRDTDLMSAGLRSLGVGIEDLDGDDWRVTPPAALRGGGRVDVGNAGTVMRFLPPVAALADGPVAFDGDRRSHERPVGPLLAALSALGARIEDGGNPGSFPVTVHGAGAVRGGPVEIDSSSSSQFVSALLLAGARFERGLQIRHVGGRLPSLPHIGMTVQFLREAGVEVDDAEPGRWTVAPGPVRGRELTIEPDLSNAAPFLAAAMVTGGTVTIADWPRHTTQPGDRLREIFALMGGEVGFGADGLTLRGPDRAAGHGVRGIDIDLADEGELTPSIAAVAALADSPSRLRGIAHLRLHETDRLAALAKELNGLGGEVVDDADGLTITPRTLHGGVFGTYEDHRLATAGAILGLVVEGVLVEDIATTRKTLPDFPGQWTAMLAGTNHAGPGGRA